MKIKHLFICTKCLKCLQLKAAKLSGSKDKNAVDREFCVGYFGADC